MRAFFCFIILISVCPSLARACTPLDPPPIEHYYTRSDVVIDATIINVQNVFDDEAQNESLKWLYGKNAPDRVMNWRAQIVVHEVFKGDAERVEVLWAPLTHGKFHRFEIGHRGLVFAKREINGVLSDWPFFGLCDHSIRFEADDVRQYLEGFDGKKFPKIEFPMTPPDF